MTAPIRNPNGLRGAVRDAIEERGIPCGNVDEIVSRAEGFTNKLISDNSGKNFSLFSLFDTLGAVGKCLVLVDDPEQIQRVSKRWQRRRRIQSVKGEQAYRASIAAKIQEMTDLQAKLAIRERMKALSKLGAKEGGKRRAKALSESKRKRIAAHAARARWAKAKEAKRRKDGKGKQRAAAKQAIAAAKSRAPKASRRRPADSSQQALRVPNAA